MTKKNLNQNINHSVLVPKLTLLSAKTIFEDIFWEGLVINHCPRLWEPWTLLWQSLRPHLKRKRLPSLIPFSLSLHLLTQMRRVHTRTSGWIGGFRRRRRWRHRRLFWSRSAPPRYNDRRSFCDRRQNGALVWSCLWHYNHIQDTKMAWTSAGWPAAPFWSGLACDCEYWKAENKVKYPWQP